jgi:hypothetical protein
LDPLKTRFGAATACCPGLVLTDQTSLWPAAASAGTGSLTDRLRVESASSVALAGAPLCAGVAAMPVALTVWLVLPVDPYISVDGVMLLAIVDWRGADELTEQVPAVDLGIEQTVLADVERPLEIVRLGAVGLVLVLEDGRQALTAGQDPTLSGRRQARKPDLQNPENRAG